MSDIIKCRGRERGLKKIVDIPVNRVRYLLGLYCDSKGIGYKGNKRHCETPAKSFGKFNPEKTFYVISGIEAKYNGPFEYWMIVAFYVMHALRHGYIPYIHDEYNRWNRCFCQPQNEYNIDDISNSLNVKFNGSFMDGDFNWNWWPVFSVYFDLLRKEYHEVYKLIHPHEKILESADKFDLPSKTLVIPLRQSFARGLELNMGLYSCYPHHHRRGFLEDYIRMGYDELERGEYDSLFIACDDRESLELIKKEFGNKCSYYERHLQHFYDKGIPVPEGSREQYSEFQGLSNDEIRFIVEEEYIIETLIISRCNTILNTPGSQVIMARIMAENDLEIIDSDIPFRIV